MQIDKTSSQASGVTIFGVAFIAQIVFLILKLNGTIKWSWFWVWSPSWLAGAYVSILLAFVVLIIVAGIVYTRLTGNIAKQIEKTNGSDEK